MKRQTHPVGISFHLAQPAEATAICTCVQAICAEGRWMRTIHFEPGPMWQHALYTANCPCHWLGIAQHTSGQIVGYCRLFSPPEAPDWAELGIGVLQAYRNCGIGRHLLQIALSPHPVCQQKRGVYLHTRADNARARHLFEQMGFVAAQPKELPSAAVGETFMHRRYPLTQTEGRFLCLPNHLC